MQAVRIYFGGLNYPEPIGRPGAIDLGPVAGLDRFSERVLKKALFICVLTISLGQDLRKVVGAKKERTETLGVLDIPMFIPCRRLTLHCQLTIEVARSDLSPIAFERIDGPAGHIGPC